MCCVFAPCSPSPRTGLCLVHLTATMSDTEEHSAAAQMNQEEPAELPTPPAGAAAEEQDAAGADEVEAAEQPANKPQFDIVSTRSDLLRLLCPLLY